MRVPPALRVRHGLSLLEVLLSLFIFLISIAAIGQIISLSQQRGKLAEYKQRGAFLCASKLAELASGVVDLASASSSPYDDPDSDWTWTADCTQDSTPGLWKVQVIASHDNGNGSKVSVTMDQWIIDPSIRGGTADNLAAQQAATATNSGSSSSGSGSSSSSSGSTGSTGGN
jgi:general secretion pathway protein I